MPASPFVIGIDLGTTNTTLAYAREPADRTEPVRIDSYAIPQVVQQGMVESRHALPSQVYLPQPHEVPAGSLQVPWDTGRPYAVGYLAQRQASLTPGRVVSSAKSWLCHPGIDRRSACLPWKADPAAKKISPLEASAFFLQHLREAWNHTHQDPNTRLEQQEIILTVPASFDAVARSLTVEAAKVAGLDQVTLLEEPQAAFYAWLDAHPNDWRDIVKVGDVILVCDVGGGTTDFTLIAVSENNGKLELHRLAVGDHILLGGDNMDLTLAHFVAQKLSQQGHKLDFAQMQALSHACRHAKEKLLGNEQLQSEPVAILGRGRKVVGGSISTELTREDVTKVLVEGFFPFCPATAEPKRTQAVGLQELGLPYAADPVVTKHMAQFLRRHEAALREHFQKTKGEVRALPTALLCNGGVFKAHALRERLRNVLDQWLTAEGLAAVKTLEGIDLDLAVARGAAYYGLVQRGRGIRIRGGTAQVYYIGVETAQPAVPGIAPPIKAVCVAPFGMEEDTQATLPGLEFGLIVGEPVQFRFLASNVRRHDEVGRVLEEWEEELQELSPLEITLSAAGIAGQTVPVQLRSRVTPIGTLEIWCVSRDDQQKWKLEFNVREQKA
jgi:molecular chaperone DnaK (HSP70)